MIRRQRKMPMNEIVVALTGLLGADTLPCHEFL